MSTSLQPLVADEVYQEISSHNESPTPLPSSQLSVQAVPETNHGVTLFTATVTVAGLNANSKYYFGVADLDADGVGPKSVEVSATTLNAP